MTKFDKAVNDALNKKRKEKIKGKQVPPKSKSPALKGDVLGSKESGTAVVPLSVEG